MPQIFFISCFNSTLISSLRASFLDVDVDKRCRLKHPYVEDKIRELDYSYVVRLTPLIVLHSLGSNHFGR